MTDFDEVATPPPSISSSAAERKWAMFAHLSGILGWLIVVFVATFAYIAKDINFRGLLLLELAICFGGFMVGPFLVSAANHSSLFITDQSQEALHFNAHVAAILLLLLISAILTLGLSLIFIPVLAIISVILIVVASIRSRAGVLYRYPFLLRSKKIGV